MKKTSKLLFVITLVLIIGASFGFATDYELTTFRTSNSRNGEKFSVGYSTGHEAFYILQSSPYNGNTTIYLDEIAMEELRQNVQKAIDWNNLAKKNKTSVDKDLPDSTIRCHLTAVMTNFGQSYSVSGNVPVLFHHKCDASGNYEFRIYATDIDYSTQTNQTYPNFPLQTMKFRNGTLEDFRKAIDADTLKTALDKQLHPGTSSSANSASGDDIFK